MDETLIALYHRHVATVFDRQMLLLDFLEREAGGEPWSYTISSATLAFGDVVRFVALDLGSHAEPDNSWLWAWCHPHLNLTSANQELGTAVRKFGQDIGVAAFIADRQVSCLEILGPDLLPVAAHVFAVVVAGELGFDAYYTMPFAHGRAAAVIRDDRLRAEAPNPVARILTIFTQVIGAFPVLDHRAAFLGYAAGYGLPVEESRQTVRVLAGGVEALKARFDRRNRLVELTGTVGPNG
jgi:hypothetical protein